VLIFAVFGQVRRAGAAIGSACGCQMDLALAVFDPALGCIFLGTIQRKTCTTDTYTSRPFKKPSSICLLVSIGIHVDPFILPAGQDVSGVHNGDALSGFWPGWGSRYEQGMDDLVSSSADTAGQSLGPECRGCLFHNGG